MRQTELLGRHFLNLVAVVAVHALRGDTGGLPQVVIGVVLESHRRRVTRGADRRAAGMLVQQTPPAPRPAVPIGARVEIQKLAAVGRAGMGACLPFLEDLAMTI